jgi:hypothetical protein
MAVTFLQAINATLKRTRTIQGDAGELATSTVTSTATGLVATGAFTDSGRQVQIDLAIQLWQEAEHEIYSMGLSAPEAATATISLVDGTREYDMPSDFERFAGKTGDERVFRGATTGLIVSEYPGGYARMLRDQPIATDFTGDPNHYAISPVTLGRIRFDREPTSDQDGSSYNVLYEKRLSLTSTMATEALPFSDTVADSLVPVVAEAWQRVMKEEFDSVLFRRSLARSMEYLSQTQRRGRYGIRRARIGPF